MVEHHLDPTASIARPEAASWTKNGDGGDIAFRPDVWRECLRVLKPGGHMCVFGGSRTFHRVWSAIEDAGFEIRDTLMYLYGVGFPKSLDVSKAIDKMLGAERDVVGKRDVGPDTRGDNYHRDNDERMVAAITTPATPEAQQWAGFGTALKPAYETICLARKPLSEKTLAQNVLKHGTGGINIAATRVPTDEVRSAGGTKRSGGIMGDSEPLGGWQSQPGVGRWPANVCHDGSEEVLEAFARFGKAGREHEINAQQFTYEQRGAVPSDKPFSYCDQGTAARFFPALNDELRFMYCPKAGRRDRQGSKHPTVKPVKLLEWLAKLICPPGGVILDCFAGSGTTGVAAQNLGFDCVLIERELEYLADIERRFAPDPALIIGDA